VTHAMGKGRGKGVGGGLRVVGNWQIWATGGEEYGGLVRGGGSAVARICQLLPTAALRGPHSLRLPPSPFACGPHPSASWGNF
jgi:hypothetical protein